MKNAPPILLPLLAAALLLGAPGCVAPRPGPLPPGTPPLPSAFPGSEDATPAKVPAWGDFFPDPVLAGWISTALTNNQELHLLLQEVAVARAETRARRGALFPFVNLGGSAGLEKVGARTRNGAVEENLEVEPGRRFPEPLPNYALSADFDWEVDIWRKLRQERDAALQRYLATREARNFVVTQLIAEVAEAYYDLLALDALLANYERMVDLQQKALESVRLKKAAARVTELAVRRFEAEVLKNRSRLFEIRQRIVETENQLHRLAGRYPGPISRAPGAFDQAQPGNLPAGVPADLLRNRPDIRQAEAELRAAG
ncbi:MAG: TolC family protein, partial [Verrucomicrobiota bacterium]